MCERRAVLSSPRLNALAMLLTRLGANGFLFEAHHIGMVCSIRKNTCIAWKQVLE